MTSTSWSGDRRAFPPRTRARILKRAGYRCQIQRPGCIGRATIADHIVPHAEGGTDHHSNGQGACSPCHDLKTREEQARGRGRRPKRERPKPPHPGRRR